MASDSAANPFVTVFVPARNEEEAIRGCVEAVLAQDYPADRFEVLVVDGASEDRTRAIVEELAADARVPVRVLDNPARSIPAAVNRALAAAQGEYLVRVDAHSVPALDYVRRAVEGNLAHDAELVGGWVEAAGTTPLTRAIAAAFGSPFAMGNAVAWRRPAAPREVASVPCGSYRLVALAAIGGYDEQQLVNEDYEANYRLRRAGGKVMLSPEVSFRYLPRRSIPALARQFARYGFYKARVMMKHPESIRPRHLVPAGGLAACTLLLAAAPVAPAAGFALAVLGAGYGVGLIGASALAGRGLGSAALLLPLVFPTMHLAWGSGNLVGLVRWLPARPWRASLAAPALSGEAR